MKFLDNEGPNIVLPRSVFPYSDPIMVYKDIEFKLDHLCKVVETTRRSHILIILDEVSSHLTFGEKPFTPMGSFTCTM